MTKYVHGLAVMRAQPFHIGHEKLLRKMLDECANVTIVLGSVQEKRTDRNPLSFAERKAMIENVFSGADNLAIIGLADIGNSAAWGSYVLQAFSSADVDAYYAGSDYDAHWFDGLVPNIEIVDRTDKNFVFVSATMVRDMIKYKDERWKNFINPKNYTLIEELFENGKTVE